MTLEEKRREWEKGLGVVAVKEESFQPVELIALGPGQIERCLVILRRKPVRDGRQNYFCYRYFKVGENWEVSADASYVDAETAMKWAFNPKALGTQK